MLFYYHHHNAGACIKAEEAVTRLKRFKEEFTIRDRKMELYCSGEELFALPRTEYPELSKTRKQLSLLDKLYNLYMEVLKTLEEWQYIPWERVADNLDSMMDTVEAFDIATQVPTVNHLII